MPYFNFRGANIYYDVVGEGTPITWVHGFMENGTMFDSFVEYFKKAGYKNIIIDLPGQGRSSSISDKHLMSDFAKCILNLWDNLDVDKSILVGHSMGGYASLEVLSMHPERVERLCLFHSTAAEDSEQKKQDRLLAIRVMQMNPEVFIKEAIPNLFDPNNIPLLEKEIKDLYKIALEMSVDGISAALRGMRERKNHIPMVQNSSIPVFYLVGENDPILPMEHMEHQFKGKNVSYVILKNVGHMGFVEAPDACVKHLLKFFQG